MAKDKTHGGNASYHILRIAFGISLLAILLLVSSSGAATLECTAPVDINIV